MIARVAILVGCLAASASAQIVYEPVRYQYGDGQPYFYAGRDPRIHEAARFPYAPGTTWGRVDGFAFVNDRRAVTQRFARTFTDAFGVRDARPFGLTISDVANEAAARVPRYFSKARPAYQRDRAASPPAGRGTIVIRPYRPRAGG